MNDSDTTDPLDITFDELAENFEFLGDWEERYRYIIDLGRALPEMPEEAKTPQTKVQGCVSQVWMISKPDEQDPQRMIFIADSDAHIVRGLIAVLLIIFSGKSPEEIRAIDARKLLAQLDLEGHLSPSRSNGLFSMVKRIEDLAAAKTAN